MAGKSFASWAATAEQKCRTVRCISCSNKKVAAACKEFAAWLEQTGAHVSWRYFYETRLRGDLGVTNITLGALQNHVRNCMHRVGK